MANTITEMLLCRILQQHWLYLA